MANLYYILIKYFCYFSSNTGNFEKQINKGDEPWLIDFCVAGGGEKLKVNCLQYYELFKAGFHQRWSCNQSHDEKHRMI